MSKPTKILNVARTSEGLRDALFDELDALRRGESNPQRAGAAAKLACQIVNSVKMEIEYQSHVRSMPSSTKLALVTPLSLGTE